MTHSMFTLKHGIIKKLSRTLTILTLLIPQAVFADSVAQSQRMLNQLGYNAGTVDGAYGGKTKRALEAFYAKSGGSFDGKLDTNEVADLTAAMSTAGIDITIQTGAEIESNGSLIYIPKQPSIIESRYWWTYASTVADFNGDGIMDAWITGTQNPPEEWKDYQSVTTGDACGKAKAGCDSQLTKPSLFIGTKDGKYLLRDDLVIDNRAKPGQSLARQNLVVDFNGDGKLDVFVADHGLGSHGGFKDSYFLSQPDGTLLESSESHLSHPNIKLFDHGGATGDIDGDGDMDVVLTSGFDGGTIHCYYNNGTGKMKMRKCASIMAFAIELADMDGDGDLDLVHHSDDRGNTYNTIWHGNRTGIRYNNGKGKFNGKSVKLPGDMTYPHSPELNVWDIDKDGDQDIVLGRVQELYAGVAIQVLENLGNGTKFNSTIYELVIPPSGYVAKGEGNPWNFFVEQLRFADVDRDGDTDIMMVNHGDKEASMGGKPLPNGSWMRNNGDMKFTFMRGPKGSQIKVIPDGAFSLNGRLPVPFETGPMSSKLKCGYATHNGKWDMEVNPKWVANMKQAGFDLEMCLFFLAD
ncbi:FG-GAP-like repeat-containing protein [Amylibacter sp.]|nr:FG-GAP-like repeat-containing protein [Amylibacter sp.]